MSRVLGRPLRRRESIGRAVYSDAGTLFGLLWHPQGIVYFNQVRAATWLYVIKIQ